MNRAQKRQLLKEGWLPREVYSFDHAVGGDVASGHRTKQNLSFSSRTFSAMRKSRRRYVADLQKQGWTLQDIKVKLNDYYRVRSASPFDWLKLEYSPTKRLTDYQDSVRRRIRAKASRLLGAAYGRNLKPEIRPKYLPKRPLYPSRPKLIRRVRRTR
jgi:hypothetical protein